MSFFQREKEDWTWRDPLRGLRHTTSKCTSMPTENVGRVWYLTWCGLQLTVDDVNPYTTMYSEPTCLACIVATLPDVLQGKV